MILAVATGLESFSDPETIGPLYPFVGWEWLFVVIGVVAWLLWHVLQTRGETREHAEACDYYDRIGIERAMMPSQTAGLLSPAERADDDARPGPTPAA